MFGWFKGRFPTVALGAEIGRFELKVFPEQERILFAWPHGDEPLRKFAVHYLESRMSYLGPASASLNGQVRAFLDRPSKAWPIVKDAKPEDYLMVQGTWCENGFGSLGGALGGPAGETATVESVKAVLLRTGGGERVDPRVAAAARLLLDWNVELGPAPFTPFKKFTARAAEAWRQAGEKS